MGVTSTDSLAVLACWTLTVSVSVEALAIGRGEGEKQERKGRKRCCAISLVGLKGGPWDGATSACSLRAFALVSLAALERDGSGVGGERGNGGEERGAPHHSWGRPVGGGLG